MIVICYYFKRLCYIQEEYASLVCVGSGIESLYTPARLLLVTNIAQDYTPLRSVTCPVIVCYALSCGPVLSHSLHNLA